AVSPRRVTVEAARTLVARVPSGVARVGVFVDETSEQIREAIEAASLDLIQIHRALREKDLRLPRPVIAVARVEDDAPPAPDGLLPRCRALLFDAAAGDLAGGTGRPFDWSALDGKRWPVPVILAGGLTAENVGAGIARVRPAAVDVASGVESAPGVKDPRKLRRFFEAVRMADARLSSPSPPGRGQG
ncbi:MAG TPA: phosphoribosylanthranilate isomerase, partial [Thermoanaerobaculia bacterium]|nr:phosphoribosylanthranilate isomerase [Thermoanaerobaculia bacterium]